MSESLTDSLSDFGAWGALLTRYIVPICEKDERGDSQGHGTGLLVANRGANFLVTAAHVLDPLRERSRLFFPCAKLKERNIGGSMLATIPLNGKCRNEDRVDIAVVRLDGDAQPPYPEVDKESLDISWLRPSPLPRHGTSWFITGFPARRTKTHRIKKQVEVGPFGHACSSIEDSGYANLGLRPTESFALEFNVNKVYVGNGPPVKAPNPQGMSGSPIWLLYDHPSENGGTGKQVVGIAIEHRHREKLIVGTDISVAIDMIQKLS